MLTTAKKEPLNQRFAFVAIAFTLCLSVGIDNHGKVQKIKNKNYHYKAKSFFRNGLYGSQFIQKKQTAIIVRQLFML